VDCQILPRFIHESRCMLQMMEWHARAAKGWTYDTWHNGRFLEEWADPYALKGLRETFAHYDEADIKRGYWQQWIYSEE